MPKKILGVMSDLFFLIRINDAAKKAGMTAEFVKDEALALEKMKSKPDAVILDLGCETADPIALIRAIKQNPETSAIPTIAFVPHVRVDLKRNAEESGCDLVVARSAFAQNLSAILTAIQEGHAVTETSSRN
jgi:CheY-like chemotaxis protein